MTAPKAQADTMWAKIYIAGDINQIKECCRLFCDSGGCVNVCPTSYIYTHGEQEGAIIEFINYPRFPISREQLLQNARILALNIMYQCHQKSYTIVTDQTSYYFERPSGS